MKDLGFFRTLAELSGEAPRLKCSFYLTHQFCLSYLRKQEIRSVSDGQTL